MACSSISSLSSWYNVRLFVWLWWYLSDASALSSSVGVLRSIRFRCRISMFCDVCLARYVEMCSSREDIHC